MGCSSLCQAPGPNMLEQGVMVSYQSVTAIQPLGESEVSQQVIVMCVGSGKRSISRASAGNSQAETDAPEAEGGIAVELVTVGHFQGPRLREAPPETLGSTGWG